MFPHWWLQILFARQISQEFIHHSNKMSMLSTVDDFQVTFACDIYIINHKSKPLIFLEISKSFPGPGRMVWEQLGRGEGLEGLTPRFPAAPPSSTTRDVSAGMSLQVPGPPHSALWTHQAGCPGPARTQPPGTACPSSPPVLRPPLKMHNCRFPAGFSLLGFHPHPSFSFLPLGRKREVKVSLSFSVLWVK